MHDTYIERDGILRCSYCGSVTKKFFDEADLVIKTDKSYKWYVVKDGKQYKFYMDHINA